MSTVMTFEQFLLTKNIEELLKFYVSFTLFVSYFEDSLFQAKRSLVEASGLIGSSWRVFIVE